MAALDAERWFDELALQGIDITASAADKLCEEAGELRDHRSLEEAADSLISLLGVVHTEGWTLDQLANAVTEKLVVLRKRRWEKQDNGTFHHIKEQAPPTHA